MGKWLWRMPASLLMVGVTGLLLAQQAAAECPFCVAENTPTLVGDFKEASMVLYGHFTNTNLANNTSEFVIEEVLKPHEIVNGKKVITLPKAIPANKSKFVIFCDVWKSNINPFRGEEVTSSSPLVAYLKNSLKLKDESQPKRLRYCFDFLDNADEPVSTDAYREFAKADYTDYKDMAKSLPAKTIAGWLEDPKTPAFRYALYASLLGHCGDPKTHGGLLRSMLDDPKKLQGSNVEGIMAGYAMLQPKEAWSYFQTLFKNEAEEFNIRYAALKTLRFFWDYRTDVLGKEQVVKGAVMLLDHQELADLAIDNLRYWKAWEQTDRVLDVFSKKTHDNTFVRSAVLRFALSSDTKRAAEFVREQRKVNPTWVGDTEEILRIEAPAPKVEPKKK